MSSKQAQFDALVRATSSDLYRFGYWLCRSAALADDLVQETYLRAWRSLDDLRDTAAAKAWLVTILRREHARLHERRAPTLESIDEREAPLPDDDAAVRAPDDVSEDTLLHRAIGRLDRKYREPLLMQVLCGYTCEEIAAELGITPQAVMTQLFRARQKLRAALAGHAAGDAHVLR
ncbi:MAG: sigma-70 family RNA polymerase sigma factor [Pseudomonadota bacterium]|jgi:RNA polymerase sigma-70 factor (ECF subfamily)